MIGSEARGVQRRRDHGWWPYVLPYFGFLLTLQLMSWMPARVAPLLLLLKPAVPLLLILHFARHGAYPELRGMRLGRRDAARDVLVGLLLALLWVAPYVLFESLRPDPSLAFDPGQLGPHRVGLTLSLRMLGYAFVTPLFEELFIRSFVMREAEVWSTRGDFRKLPLAQYSAKSFIVTTVVFTLGHAPWEWWVAVPWVMLTNLWFYRRRSLLALMLVHGTTNASLLALAFLADGRLHGAVSEPLSLWIFV